MRPEVLVPLLPGREYRIMAIVRRKIARGAEFTAYGDLYRRATAIADARIGGLIHPGFLRSWILCHGWRRIDIGAANDLLIVFVARGVVCRQENVECPHGEAAPTVEELRSPGGATMEQLASPDAATRRADEIYNEFDHRDASSAHSDMVMFSYGEYVPSCEGLDYGPVVERAERLAKFHHGLLNGPRPKSDSLHIVRREWMCATHPDLAVVHVHFRV